MTRSYDNSHRLEKKRLRDLIKTLQQIAKEPREGRPRSQRRRERRERLLPKDRKCPLCGKIRLKSKQWVCNKHELGPICKSCFMKGT